MRVTDEVLLVVAVTLYYDLEEAKTKRAVRRSIFIMLFE